MNTNVFIQTLHERWRGLTIGSVTLAIFFLFAMAVYKDVDLGFYEDFPEAVQMMMNIPEGAGVGSLAYGAIYGLYGALVMGILAVMAGASLIAGEERNGTLGLLLANPKSRTVVLVSKTAALLLLLALGTVVLDAGGRFVPAILDVEIAGMQVEAQLFHIFINSVFYGMLAVAIGAWTGNGGLASGVTIGLMIVSMLAAGLLPLVDNLAEYAKVFPWYYFDGSDPVNNGIEWGHIAVLFSASVLFAVLAIVGVNRRDLKAQAVGVTLIDRLRRNPTTQKLVERIAGTAKVSHIWVKTASDHQVLLIAAVYYMFLVGGIVIGPFYSLLDDSLIELSDQLPDTLMALAGGGDMGSPEGFYMVENFGLMAPLIFMMVTVTVGARALAGEESKRTMGLLLANPISRSRIVYEKMAALTALAAVLGLATFGGTLLGSLLGSLDMNVWGIASISVHATLLGLVFGSLALALSAAVGKVKIAVFGSVGPAVIFYLLDSFLPLNDNLAGLARWTPFYYYSDSNPLVNGMHWGHIAVLLSLTVILVVASVIFFNRRDLRQTD